MAPRHPGEGGPACHVAPVVTSMTSTASLKPCPPTRSGSSVDRTGCHCDDTEGPVVTRFGCCS